MTSSAYNLTVDKMLVGKSFMKYKNNNGVRTVLCGTLDVTWVVSPLTTCRTRCRLPVKNLSTIPECCPGFHTDVISGKGVDVIPYQKL